MFRLKENVDGTFNVYDSSTGNLVMVVTKENKENGHVKSCASMNRADQKMVRLISSVNCNATDVCRKKLFPVVTLQNINVRALTAERPPTHVEVPKVDSRCCPLKMTAEVAEPLQASDVDDEYDCIDQDSFMKFFGLSSTKEGLKSVRNLEKFRERLNMMPVIYPRNDLWDVDVSSNLGALMRDESMSNCKPTESSRSLISKYEVYCQTANRRLGNWDASFRKNSTNYIVTYPARRQCAGHLYVFNRRQRLQQYRRLKTGLTKRSRQLAKLCRDCSVKLTRVTDTQIKICCANVRLEPKLVGNLDSNPSDANLYSVKNIFHVGETDVCIDGTIVIEIDEFGSETVTVSQKPSKMINHHTGNPWLSPRKVSNATALTQYARSVVKPSFSSLHHRLISPEITILPLQSDLVKRGGDVIAANQADSDAESEIEFLGSVVKIGNKVTPCPILSTLINSGPSPANGEVLRASGDAIFNPLDYVRATYDDDWNDTSLSPSSDVSRVKLAINSSPMDKVNLLRKPGRFSVHKVDLRHLSSDSMLTTGNVRVGTLPCTSIPTVVPCELPPRLQEFSSSAVQLLVDDNDQDDYAPRSPLRQAEILLISNLVKLGETPVDAVKPLERNCALVCHICHLEEVYEADAVGRIYSHMTNHGGLSQASLVSSLEYRFGQRLVVLQAFPLDAV